ncbi:MAG: hypothetical protein ABF436_11795 [Acetobacter okinawensis]|uniref:hypothetical protein n=1 Tax=Acetobacter okinawensis TaxID=1076594 RepID=UPI000A5284A2
MIWPDQGQIMGEYSGKQHLPAAAFHFSFDFMQSAAILCIASGGNGAVIMA